MTLEALFRRVAETLRREKTRFAVAGGLAASVYRDRPRATNDLDFLILASPDAAAKILRAFGLKTGVARKADLEGGPIFARKRGNTPAFLLVGRNPDDKTRIGVDFILPEMPWFLPALERAELNRIDFGFGPLPTLTVEDVVVAKLYALKNDARRFKDLDDLQSIFRGKTDVDLTYLSERMRALSLPFPRELEMELPNTLRKISKKLRKRRPS